MSEIRDKVIKSIADFIGEGTHTGLRKWCESAESNEAWLAIRNMPGEEWSNVALELAKYILEAIPELAIVDREAGLPNKPFLNVTVYKIVQREMIEEGWVKEVKD